MMKQNHLGFVDLDSSYFSKWNIEVELEKELKDVGKLVAQNCLQFDYNSRNIQKLQVTAESSTVKDVLDVEML